MTRIHTQLESHVQRAISQHRKALLAELAADDLRKATASLPKKDAEVYRAALRRELDEADHVRSDSLRPLNPAARARAAGDALFTLEAA